MFISTFDNKNISKNNIYLLSNKDQLVSKQESVNFVENHNVLLRKVLCFFIRNQVTKPSLSNALRSFTKMLIPTVQKFFCLTVHGYYSTLYFILKHKKKLFLYDLADRG